MEKLNEKYLRGFNHAYLLKQHNPKLIEKLLSTTSNNDYIQGLKDGAQTLEQQKTKSRTQQLQDLKSRRDKDRDIEL